MSDNVIQLHPENLIPGRKTRAWRKIGNDWVKGWVDGDNSWHASAVHRWTWRAIARLGWNTEATSTDIDSLKAILRLSVRKLYALMDDNEYNELITSLLKEDEFAEAWKEMTMKLVDEAIKLFPFPEGAPDGVEDLFNDFVSWFAEQFYDLLFSIKL